MEEKLYQILNEFTEKHPNINKDLIKKFIDKFLKHVSEKEKIVVLTIPESKLLNENLIIIDFMICDEEKDTKKYISYIQYNTKDNKQNSFTIIKYPLNFNSNFIND